MTEEKHSNIAENTENHTVCIKEEPFRPPTDWLARIAVIAAAVELIFGLLMLLKCIFEFETNKYSSEAVGWHNITVTLLMLVFAVPPIFHGVIALIYARTAFSRYQKTWIRDGECKICIMISFLFDFLGMLLPLFALWIVLSWS